MSDGKRKIPEHSDEPNNKTLRIANPNRRLSTLDVTNQNNDLSQNIQKQAQKPSTSTKGSNAHVLQSVSLNTQREQPSSAIAGKKSAAKKSQKNKDNSNRVLNNKSKKSRPNSKLTNAQTLEKSFQSFMQECGDDDITTDSIPNGDVDVAIATDSNPNPNPNQNAAGTKQKTNSTSTRTNTQTLEITFQNFIDECGTDTNAPSNENIEDNQDNLNLEDGEIIEGGKFINSC